MARRDQAAPTHHHGGMVPGPDDLLAAPVGVALLDRLELAQRELTRSEVLADSDPASVEGAAEMVEFMPIGTLLRLAIDDDASLAGPWNSGAADWLAQAYQLSETRRPLAEAIWRRLGDALLSSIRLDSQEYWRCELHPQLPIGPALPHLSGVYRNGAFPWGDVDSQRAAQRDPPRSPEGLGCVLRADFQVAHAGWQQRQGMEH